jgi:hypothetical protein
VRKWRGEEWIMSRTMTGCVSTRTPFSIFISYAHKDERFRRELERHLAFLRREGRLVVWHDRMLCAGDAWRGCIGEHLRTADIILLLISSDFAASDYCWDVEMKLAMERRERGSAIVVPILVRSVAGWAESPLGRLQVLPRDARPVSSWRNRDEAYRNIAEGLHDLIREGVTESGYAEPEWVNWQLFLEGKPEDYSEQRLAMIGAGLRRAANSEKLEIIELLGDSAKLSLRSTQEVMRGLSRLHRAGELDTGIKARVLGIEPPPGAVLRIESTIVDGEYRSSIRYLPEIFGGRALDEGFPPLVGGITFPLQDPLKIGFSLLADATHEMPTREEQLALQQRLGRYLNALLVLTGDQVNVTLSPTEDYCGLPELLRHTELGRDLLAQDVVLKHYTASQLHPSTLHGRAFWDRVHGLSSGQSDFESCFRVWIVPGKTVVSEKMVADQGQVTIDRLELQVLCEDAPDAICRWRALRHPDAEIPGVPEANSEIVAAFEELILPEIQKEVSLGARFGLLRQILSVLVVAKWIRESQLGDRLRQIGFIDANTPERYGLNTVDDAVMVALKRTYLQIFGAGIWHHAMKRINLETGLVEQRLYVAGGLSLDWRAHSDQR